MEACKCGTNFVGIGNVLIRSDGALEVGANVLVLAATVKIAHFAAVSTTPTDGI